MYILLMLTLNSWVSASFIYTNLLPVLVPAQLSGHDLYDPGQSLVSCLDIEEGQSRPASQDIDGCTGILSHCVLDLCLNVWELLRQPQTFGNWERERGREEEKYSRNIFIHCVTIRGILKLTDSVTHCTSGTQMITIGIMQGGKSTYSS